MKFNTTMYRNIYRYIPFCFVILAAVLLASCDKMSDSYSGFLEGGEKIYTGRVDSLKAFPGRNRIKLQWLLVSDPKIVKCKVYWNDGKDSSVMNVQKTAATDTIKLNLNNMAEGTYTFRVYTYDNAGHSSVKSEVIGTVYGDNYANSISNRPLKSATYYTAASAQNTGLQWYGISDQAAVIEIKYTDVNGNAKTVTQLPEIDPNRPTSPPAFTNVSNLPLYKPGTSFSYRTGYKPVPSAIDIFYTDYTTVTTIGTQMFQMPGNFKIIARHSGKALLIPGASTSTGAAVVQSAFDGTKSAVWQLTDDGTGTITITNFNSQMVMNVKGAATTDAAVIEQQNINTGAGQTQDEWILEPIDSQNKYFRIKNVKSGKVVEVVGSSTADGTAVQQRTYSGGTNQQFEIIRL